MTGSEAPSPTSPSFRLAYVPGVTPTKWVRIWKERLADVPLTLVAASPAEVFDVLREGGADAGFVRLPVDRTDLAAIPLYTETTVVVIPKDHVIAAVEEITADDLAEELVLHPLDDTLVWEQLPGVPAKERPATTADAIELVAAGVGVLIVPQSLARLHHRKDLTYRTVTGTPESRVALSWPHTESGEPTELVEHFIGIVRGRTVNSTRGPALPKNAADAKKQKRTEKPKQSPRKPAAKGGGSAKPKPGGGRAVAKNSRNTPKRGKPRR
ncbi:LysR family substrate-binding domain-containing protein [Streptomyces sp. NBC_00237]|uniref:LysR family substrate-binding domain-containing protein n=1 Tax=Streptomyces sp. NBC_00237 TaxID=2975687 RepID=UPI002259BE9A|nr:LysR family substrate-binding domain-containing protein [Streptomyces sp. NBC_00237]MCX5206536.1 LysR family substrate-binding domain-containing protein [Streptomyces sp. NBC_00237]